MLKIELSKGVTFAKSFSLEVARFYWSRIRDKRILDWDLREYVGPLVLLNQSQFLEAKKFAEGLPEDTLEAGYKIANKYMLLLPRDFRQKYGVFFTPLSVVKKMLNDAESEGIDFQTASVVDPSAGGAAFLAPLCRRMIRKDLIDPKKILTNLLRRLKGFEIDPFSAWLSQFLIDCELAINVPTFDRPEPIIECKDALYIEAECFGLYDLVIGNPPYGKINISSELKDQYRDVLYGVPNLYQLFYALALKLAKKDGMIQLITPTSFIGGDYFKNLRGVIEVSASPLRFDFFESRTHIFEGVQQELVITIFKKGKPFQSAPIYQVKKENAENLFVEKVGVSCFPEKTFWVLPKDKKEALLSRLYDKQLETLESLGFKVKTGYVVPHRSEGLLGNHRRDQNSFPIIWSEAIQGGSFNPKRAFNRGKACWYSPPTDKNHPGLVKESVLLIKRISSKEQSRRIHSAMVPPSYLTEFNGFFAENHVNVLYPCKQNNIDLDTVNKLLSTQLIDLIFRSISGSVTVSAAELKRLPMPEMRAFLRFKELVKRASKEEIEDAAWQAYGVPR